MAAPVNRLKAALARGELQRGLWLSLGSAAVAEIAGRSGADWCLVDAEHGPNTIDTILPQLQALAGTPAEAVVRVPAGEDWMLKQVLDLGVQTVLVPMVDSAEEARAAAAALRYPPEGRRGMGAALIRASGYGRSADYATTANREICLIVQAESRAAIDAIDDIAAVEGVDCVFVGPADLAADMGHAGRPDAPEVQDAIDHAIGRILASGKAAGIVTFDPAEVRTHAARGVTFLGIGADAPALAAAFDDLVSASG